MSTRRHFIAAGIAAAAAGALPARAQQGKPVRLIVGFPAGGSSDALARLLAQALRSSVDGPIVVDNRAGAGGRLGAELLKAADADGSTVLITPNPIVTIYPHVYRKLNYDPLKDLQAAARLATYPLVIGVGPMVPASVRSFPEFVTWLKANPGQAFYGSPGSGSTPHFVGQMLGKAIGIDLKHVAYKGDAPGIQDLLAGQIAMSINTPAAQVPQLGGGRLRILASTGAVRGQLPDVPTLQELGWGIRTADWFGAFLPGGTPGPVVQRWQDALRDALARQEVREGLLKLQLDPAWQSAADFSRAIREEHAQWGATVKATGFVPED